MDDEDLTSEHIKAARALLRWEQKTLADKAGVSLPTIGRLEMSPGKLGGYSATKSALRSCLESAGIEFTNGGSPGVRLVKPKAKRR